LSIGTLATSLLGSSLVSRVAIWHVLKQRLLSVDAMSNFHRPDVILTQPVSLKAQARCVSVMDENGNFCGDATTKQAAGARKNIELVRE
jgi:hypothetical protein